MHYKTTIEVVTEADDKNEAADIAGEFLRGDINSGAEVRVNTISVAKSKALRGLIISCSVAAFLASLMVGNHVYCKIAKLEKRAVTSYAIQPPLRTNLSDVQGKEFKKAWGQAQQNQINAKAR